MPQLCTLALGCGALHCLENKEGPDGAGAGAGALPSMGCRMTREWSYAMTLA